MPALSTSRASPLFVVKRIRGPSFMNISKKLRINNSNVILPGISAAVRRSYSAFDCKEKKKIKKFKREPQSFLSLPELPTWQGQRLLLQRWREEEVRQCAATPDSAFSPDKTGKKIDEFFFFSFGCIHLPATLAALHIDDQDAAAYSNIVKKKQTNKIPFFCLFAVSSKSGRQSDSVVRESFHSNVKQQQRSSV